jgi:UDPglucose 6-dehydrogenase
MKMSVIGCGHLGATHAACMALIGHHVLGVDIDEDKVRLLNSGKAWFYEPGLDEMLVETMAAGRLRFTTSFEEAAEFGRVHFIGVATPGRPDGSYDLSQLHSAMSSLVPWLRTEALVVGKSTVPPGTAAALQDMAGGLARECGATEPDVAWNPEFLREGCAVQDTLRPDRIVVGSATPAARATLRTIYQPLTDTGVAYLDTDLATAELVKGAANSFLATKISFINAMSDICSATGGDVGSLAAALGLDPRIGSAYLRAGIGYGGACLPKDVRGLAAFARGIGANNAVQLLTAVDSVNAARGGQVLDLIREAIGEVEDKRLAVWGAAFKAGTDDVRDSPGLQLASVLHLLGARVTVYDPMATEASMKAMPSLDYADSAAAAVADADALIVATPWPEFGRISPADAADVIGDRIVVDACHALDIDHWEKAGWRVHSLTGPRPAPVIKPATEGEYVRAR